VTFRQGKTKMVPSDPKTSLFPDRHARSERGIRRWRGLCPLLPAAGFGRLRIEALVRARNPSPVEARFSMRPFTPRQRELVLQPVPAAGLTLPACIFKAILKLPRARSVLRSRPRPAF
jgi:hypothetical protein